MPPPPTTNVATTKTTATVTATNNDVVPTTKTTAADDGGPPPPRRDENELADAHDEGDRQGRKKRPWGGSGTIDERDQCHDRDDGEPRPFALLPVHGEHKRAVSSLSFAPTPPSSLLGGNSWNSNGGSRSTHVLCASASADGSAKVWETPTRHDVDDDIAADGDVGGGGEGGGRRRGQQREGGSSSSFMIGSGRTTTSSSRLDPRLSLVGHSRGINGKRDKRKVAVAVVAGAGASFDFLFAFSPVPSYHKRHLITPFSVLPS